MTKKRESRSEETKRSILQAAGRLFADKGYHAVTMREIAQAAGCSHTTIYIYFQDKEVLLHQLSAEPLQQLKADMEDVLEQASLSPEVQLKGVSREFIRFCLLNRTMYTIFFEVKSARVDDPQPTLELNSLRNQLFAVLKQAVQGCLHVRDEDRLLAFTRVFFFMLHGIVGTYQYSEEDADAIMDRLSPTFDESVEVLLLGFRHKLEEN